MEITVTETEADTGKRLDLFISLKIPQISRSSIKKVIESNKVLVNNEVCYKAGYKVRVGDIIIFPESELIQQNSFQILPKSKFDLDIIFEDEDYLFINKPVGLLVHPTNPSQNNTLVNKLIDLYADLPGNNFLRPGIVHRLDKDTSGVIIVAKNPKSLWWISSQFADRKVKKEYISIGINLDANFRYSSGSLFEYECYLRRSSRDRKQFTAEDIKPRVKPKGRFSKSKFEIIDVFKLNGMNIIYSKIFPLTGRTHQIRVHQKQNNFPILGDPIYLSSNQVKHSAKMFQNYNFAQRLYLHSHCVTFENYNRKVYSIIAQIPKDFDYVIQEAKKKIEHKN